MRYPAPDPVDLSPSTDRAPWEGTPKGPMVLPGPYSVTLSRRVEGQPEEIGSAREFVLKPLYSGGLVAQDRASVLEFQVETAELYRAVMGANRAAGELETRIKHLCKAVEDTPAATENTGRSHARTEFAYAGSSGQAWR